MKTHWAIVRASGRLIRVERLGSRLIHRWYGWAEYETFMTYDRQRFILLPSNYQPSEPLQW